MKTLLHILCLSLISVFTVHSQSVGELSKQLEGHARPDTTRNALLCDLAWGYLEINADSSKYYALRALNLARKLNHKKMELDAVSALGNSYRILGDNDAAIKVFQEGLRTVEGNDEYRRNECALLNNLGNVYNVQRDFLSAIIYYKKAHEIAQVLKEPQIRLTTLNNMIGVYRALGEYDRAIEYAEKARALAVSVQLPDQEASLLVNLSTIYVDKKRFQTGLEYLKKAEKIYTQLNHVYQLATVYNNMGIVYRNLKQYPKSIEVYNRALDTYIGLRDTMSIAMVYENIGVVYADLKDFDNSNMYGRKGGEIARKMGYMAMVVRCNSFMIENYCAMKQAQKAEPLVKENERLIVEGFADELEVKVSAYDSAKKYYRLVGDYKKALELSEKSEEIKERMISENMENKLSFMQVEMDVLAKENQIDQLQADNLLKEKEKRIRDAELNAKKNQQYFLIVGVLGLLIFSYFVYNRLRFSKRQNEIITLQRERTERQKQLLEVKNKEIADSIAYAERIQRSMLSGYDLLQGRFSGVVRFYQPKDVVSGDFYWAQDLSQEKLILLNADSTGHGVPGALMSMLNLNVFRETVEVNGLESPGAILTLVRSKIIRLLQGDQAESAKDGMDCAVLVFDADNKSLTFSGANQDLWLLRDGEILEYKGNKMPVGVGEKHDLDFSEVKVELNAGDQLFLFTDGYIDQFGGPLGKKIMKAGFRKIILEASNLSPEAQAAFIRMKFEEWKGRHEQIDDVSVIGIHIA